MSKVIMLLCTLSVVYSKLEVDFTNSKITNLEGQKDVNDFIQSNQVRVVYYYKKDVRYLKFFFKELEKSTAFLEMYGVKTGFCNCTEDASKDVQDCKKEGLENSVHTYRSGGLLLSLELETMFDVNSIMSNILQLVMLRDVPILQTVKEVEKHLGSMRGKKDIIFGHMKAIGTFDHRVFMEVAYAYMNKLQFAICTDKKATKLFEQPQFIEKEVSTVWWVWTKAMSTKDSSYHNIRYRGDLNLKAFATFVGTVTKPRMFSLPSEGLEHPYPDEAPIVRFYHNSETETDVYQKASLLTQHLAGHVGIVVINLDHKDAGRVTSFQRNTIPTMSFQYDPEAVEQFLPSSRALTSDNIATFMEESMGSKPVYPNIHGPVAEPLDESGEADNHPEDEEWRDQPFNIEDVEKQDDPVAYMVDRTKKVPMALDLVTVFDDQQFPMIAEMKRTVIMLYFPFDAISMGNLRMFGEAVQMLGKQKKLVIGRVNCYDWTDICQKENITIYPTLRIYSNGQKLWDYTGPQDTRAMFSTLKLLEMSLPLYVNKEHKVKQYIFGPEDQALSEVTNTTVVGLFRKGDKQEMDIFKELAENSRERIMFVYTTVISAEVAMEQYGATLPAVILARYDDSVQPYVLFAESYTLHNLENFIENNRLPKIPVLTPLMFPEVRKKSSEMVILFTNSSDNSRQLEDSVREIVKAQQFNNVSFSLMQVPHELSVGYKVLEQYTTEPEVPHLSLVKFTKGEVFNFAEGNRDVESVTNWLSGVVKGVTEPSTNLKDAEWKPRSKGYEFLKIIDWEAKNRKGEEQKSRAPDEIPAEAQGGKARGSGENTVPESYKEAEPAIDDEEEDDSETRKDLFALKDSRLYHQAPGRVHHHGDRKDRGDYSNDEGYSSDVDHWEEISEEQRAELERKKKLKEAHDHTEL